MVEQSSYVKFWRKASAQRLSPILGVLPCSRPWKAATQRSNEEPTVFTSGAFHSVLVQEAGMQPDVSAEHRSKKLTRVKSQLVGFSHRKRVGVAVWTSCAKCDTERDVKHEKGLWLQQLSLRKSSVHFFSEWRWNFCSETALVECVCRWLSAVELTEVDWIWIKVFTRAWRVPSSGFPWG